ncbi:trypsin-like serine peptidase [Myxococcota bacterium]
MSLVVKASPFWRSLGRIAPCIVVLCTGCEGNDSFLESSRSSQLAVVYGDDSRQEYYEVADGTLRHLFEAHAVALVNKHWVPSLLEGAMDRVPTWGEFERLCPDEPFANQPAAAFCSGVLAGAGLVLTSGHCLYGTPVKDIRVVFGYYLVAEARLALRKDDVYEVSSIVSRSSEDNNRDGVDFAWLRLAEKTRFPHAPAPVFARDLRLSRGDGIVTVSAGGGIPLKVDTGGSVLDVREGTKDFFVADTDTFRGSSGGGAFTAEGALVGFFARGNPDLQQADAGCRTTVRRGPGQTGEQFTYVHRAVEGLCRVESKHALCKIDCVQPCHDRLLAVSQGTASCALAPLRYPIGRWWMIILGAFHGLVAGLRRRKRCAERPKARSNNNGRW